MPEVSPPAAGTAVCGLVSAATGVRKKCVPVTVSSL